jgi:hypothetical protein
MQMVEKNLEMELYLFECENYKYNLWVRSSYEVAKSEFIVVKKIVEDMAGFTFYK